MITWAEFVKQPLSEVMLLKAEIYQSCKYKWTFFFIILHCANTVLFFNISHMIITKLYKGKNTLPVSTSRSFMTVITF